MTVRNFVPKVWSTRLLAHLDKNLVYGDIVNKEYEGEIKDHGDSVKINQIGDVTIKDYAGTVDDPEELTASQVNLDIDKAKYFNFQVKDIDTAQANVNILDGGTQRAGYGLGDKIDQDIAALVAQADIDGGSHELTVENAYDTIVDLGVKLDENNVNRTDRFIVLPPFVLGLLAKDPRFTKDYSVLANGVVEGAYVGGFEVRMSNNVPKATKYFNVMAGSKSAVAFAGQVSQIEGYRPEKAFSDAVKGLYVYGAKVIQPKALAQIKVAPFVETPAG